MQGRDVSAQVRTPTPETPLQHDGDGPEILFQERYSHARRRKASLRRGKPFGLEKSEPVKRDSRPVARSERHAGADRSHEGEPVRGHDRAWRVAGVPLPRLGHSPIQPECKVH